MIDWIVAQLPFKLNITMMTKALFPNLPNLFQSSISIPFFIWFYPVKGIKEKFNVLWPPIALRYEASEQ